MSIDLRYDAEADAIFVAFQALPPGSVKGARPLDDARLVHVDGAGNVVGVEFLEVSRGVDLAGVPEAEAIRDAMATIGAAVSAA